MSALKHPLHPKKFVLKDGRKLTFTTISTGHEGAVLLLVSECFGDKFTAAVGKEKMILVIQDMLDSRVLSRTHTYVGTVGDEAACFYFVDFANRQPEASYLSVVALGVKTLGLFGAAAGLLAYMPLIIKSHSVRKDSLHIVMLGVGSEYRNLGISKALLEHAESIAKESGFNYLSLDVIAENSRAIHVYGADGFKTVKTYTFPLIGRLCGITRSLRMEKKLG